jgi:hypothetical protein
MDQKLKALEDITNVLLQVNVTTPIVGGLVLAIAAIVKSVRGNSATLSEKIDLLESRIDRTDAAIQAEIARLRMLAAE